MSDYRINIIVEGRDQASGALNSVHASLGRIAEFAIGGLLVEGLRRIGHAIAGVASETMHLGASFQDQMAVLTFAAAGAGESMETLHDAALAVGGDVSLLGVSASGAAESMTGLFKAGLTSTEIFGDLQGYLAGTVDLGGALRASIDLAAATELDMVRASDLAAIALATFGSELETEEERAGFVNVALNNFVQAADASVAEVSGLADALRNVGPTAAAFGFGIEDVNNALAILSTRGIVGSESGTALKSMLTNMLRPMKAVKEALSDLNISLYDEAGMMLSLPEMIGQFQGALGGLTDEQRNQYVQTIAGTYGMKAMQTLLAEGVEGWDAMAAATAQAAGMQVQAAAKATTFNGRMEALNGALETVKIGIAEAFLPAATQLVNWFIGMVDEHGPALQRMFEGLVSGITALLSGDVSLVDLFPPEVVANVQAFVEGLRPVGEIITGEIWPAIVEFLPTLQLWGEQLLTLASSALPLFAQAWQFVADNWQVWMVLMGAMVALILAVEAPIVLVIAALAALYLAWVNDWGGIRTFVEGVVAELSAIWTGTLLPALEMVGNFIQMNVVPVFQTIADVAGTVVGTAITVLTAVWENILYPALQLVWGFIQNSLVPLFQALADVASAVVGVAVTALAGLWENVLQPALSAVWGVIQDKLLPVFEKVAGFIQDNVGPALEKLGNVILPPIAAAFDAIGAAIQTVIEWLGKVADKFNAIELPWWLQPGSPTPFELGLWGIEGALRDVTAGMQGLGDVAGGIGGFGGGGGGGRMVVVAPIMIEDVGQYRDAAGQWNYEAIVELIGV